MFRSFYWLAAAFLALSACVPPQQAGEREEMTGASSATAEACPAVGSWVAPADGARLTTAQVLDRIAGSRVVLLTELHDRPDHHRWQLQMLAALHAGDPDMAIGFEMFPRKVQPALDDWVAGELGDAEFLKRAGWWRHWGFDPDLYLPLFHFARLNGLEMRALNLERPIIARVAREGLEWVPPAERRGVRDPAPLSEGYLARLLAAYRQHLPEDKREDVDRKSEGFQHFVEAQALRDRAMAEAIADMVAPRDGKPGKRYVAAILGRGHADYGDGVPAQLADLGLEDVAVLTPWWPGEDCAAPEPEVADALFVLANDEPAPPPKRLGVRLKPAAHGNGLEIFEVQPHSAAKTAGLRTGDRIVKAGGRSVAELDDLQLAIWQTGESGSLPLAVERDGETRELLVRLR